MHMIGKIGATFVLEMLKYVQMCTIQIQFLTKFHRGMCGWSPRNLLFSRSLICNSRPLNSNYVIKGQKLSRLVHLLSSVAHSDCAVIFLGKTFSLYYLSQDLAWPLWCTLTPSPSCLCLSCGEFSSSSCCSHSVLTLRYTENDIQ